MLPTEKITEQVHADQASRHERNCKKNEFTLQNVPTELMIADILTQPLQGDLFRALKSKMRKGGVKVAFQLLTIIFK